MRKRGAFALTLATTAAAAAFMVPSAFGATSTTIYNNTPSPVPGNFPSFGFEATQLAEFGGQVEFEGTVRSKPIISVQMSSWGCESGAWHTNNCSTPKGATFTHPIRLNVYKVRQNDEPGRLVGVVTKNVKVPYRPSANFGKCKNANAGRWWNKADNTCYNGYAWNLRLSLGDLDLPDRAIVSVEYNTTHYGYEPIGEAAPCFTEDGGCGYDALNVAVANDGTTPYPVTHGSQPNPDDAYINSHDPTFYCDGGAGGIDIFRLDAGCNTLYQPILRINAGVS